MLSHRDNLRNFFFRTLMFEAEAEKFRKAGIQVGTDLKATEEKLLKEELSPF